MSTYTDGYYIYELIQHDQYRIVRYCDGCGKNFCGEFFPLSIKGSSIDHVLYCFQCMTKLKPVSVRE